ncbi:MAG: PEGA domain-containing protein [Proteobacteria bacterium]|nr:PEGA domain-containing protein [Pseudomonadota bacterium]
MNLARSPALTMGLLLFVQTGSALAEEPNWILPPAVPSENPSPEHKRVAERFFEQGATLYNELMYRDAADKFRQAAQYWLHPEIQLYLSLALSRSGESVAAYDSFQKAVGLGLDQLDPDDRQRARDLQDTLLRQQVATIEVRCDEPGAEVSLDGALLFVGPGTRTVAVRPTSHVVTTDKPGYFPARQFITLAPGHRGSIVIELGEDKLIETRRWPGWKPWATVVAGTAIALAGVGVLWLSDRDFDRADRNYTRSCDSVICPPSTLDPYNRAKMEARLGVGVVVAGTAVAAAGLLLVALNRPYSVPTDAPETPAFDITPMVSNDRVGVMSRIQF